MVSFYNLIDLVLIVLISYFTYISYKKQIYVKVFEYFKLFAIITISTKLASTTATILSKAYIIKADTYTTLILISFALNFIILFLSWKYIFKIINKYFNSSKTRIFFAKIFTFLEVFVVITFSIYIVMQLYISKVYLYKTMKKSYSYSKIEKFYNNFLNDDFISILLNSDTGTNHKEIIYKNFKNSF